MKKYPTDVQMQLLEDWDEIRKKLAETPRQGEGSLTRRHMLAGALEYNVRLSNWIDRQFIKDKKP